MLALIEPSAEWLTFAGTTLVALAGISVAVINTRRKIVEIHHLVNSRAAAQDARIAQLFDQLVAAGIVPDGTPSPDIALAGGTMTVTGDAVTAAGDVVQVTGEAVIQPDPPDSEQNRPDNRGG